jgi:hypothetical protein
MRGPLIFKIAFAVSAKSKFIGQELGFAFKNIRKGLLQ